MQKRKIVIIISVISGFIVLFFAGCLGILIFSPGDVLATEDIHNYNTDKYPIYFSGFFPEEIPQDAEVVHFSYYVYWKEDSDIYLELKFDSYEEMYGYLSEIENQTDTDKTFISTENEYNNSYSELFNKSRKTYSQGKSYTGYEIKADDSVGYHCNFEVISYSYEELTVIHSYTAGHFYPPKNKHIPVYFKRFNVPLEENHQRIFILEDIE